MTNLYAVPVSLDAALSQLNGYAELLTATEWKRAALVFAFTTDTKGGRPSKDGGNLPSSGEVSVIAFSKLGIKGLKHQDVVAAYRRRFAEQVEAGTVAAPVPGSTVDLSGLPEWNEAPGVHAQWRVEKNATTEVQVAAVQKILEANPEVAQQVSAEVRAEVEAEAAERAARAKVEAEEVKAKALAAADAAAIEKARHAAEQHARQARAAHLRDMAAQGKEQGRSDAEHQITEFHLVTSGCPTTAAPAHAVVGMDLDEVASFSEGYSKGFVEIWNAMAREHQRREHEKIVAQRKLQEAKEAQERAEAAKAAAEARAVQQVASNIEASIVCLEANAASLTTEQRNRLIEVVAPATASRI